MKILRRISAAILAVMLAASTSIIGFAASSSLDEAKSVAEKYAYAIQTRNGSAAYDCIMHAEDYSKPLNVNQKRQINLDGMKQLVVNGKFTEFEILSVVGDSQQATVIVRTTSHGEDEQAELHLKKIGNRYKVDKLFRDSSRKASESGHASAKTNQSSEKNFPETRGLSITYSFLCDPGDTSSLEGIRVASLRKGKYFRIAGNQQYAVGKDDGNLSVIYEIFQNA